VGEDGTAAEALVPAGAAFAVLASCPLAIPARTAPAIPAARTRAFLRSDGLVLDTFIVVS